MTHFKNPSPLSQCKTSTRNMALVGILLSGLLTFRSPPTLASDEPNPAHTENPNISTNVQTSPKNGFALLGVLQGTGSYIGTGIGLQSPKFWDFLSIQLNLVSNSAGQADTWWESVLAFRLVPQTTSSNHIRPYVSLELAKEFWAGADISGDAFYVRSPSVGVEFKNLVKSPWGNESLRTNTFFFEISPQRTAIRDLRGELVDGSSILIKAGFGIVL